MRLIFCSFGEPSKGIYFRYLCKIFESKKIEFFFAYLYDRIRLFRYQSAIITRNQANNRVGYRTLRNFTP